MSKKELCSLHFGGKGIGAKLFGDALNLIFRFLLIITYGSTPGYIKLLIQILAKLNLWFKFLLKLNFTPKS